MMHTREGGEKRISYAFQLERVNSDVTTQISEKPVETLADASSSS